ncbi:hypothetical protein AMAG_08483 [Allomyces macrogynus ATCC 38327]|uniref:BHLH domain-containing protein n=1 Tax=Allomyces macrogynus (strain ATCC 38327) TaxID=578462 RepID=A0A0L0SLR7_ALLM3|nr:hypothetical protein AMAG_08483 [Allomyces macrogynus ATCC 38327]|eukprot:KNE63344.1 hypothetical protein AMAG_08483 [Allomyces macrogynus ATCC 38327]
MTTPPSTVGPALLSADEQRRLSEFLAHLHDPTVAPAPAAPPLHAEHLAHPLFLTDTTAAPASVMPGLPLMAPLPPPPPATDEPAGNKRRCTTDAASASRVGKEKRARTASALPGPSTDGGAAAASKKGTKRAAPKRVRAVSATTADAVDPSGAGDADAHASGSAATASGRKSNRVLLTDEVKKRNHIASEQKRRQNIRHGFDLLMRLVPGLAALPRSESVILHRTTAYLQQLLDDHARLKRRAIELQVALGELPPEALATARPDVVSEDDEPVTVPVIVPLDEPAGGEDTPNGGTVAAVVPAELPPIKIRTYRRTVYNNNKRRRRTSDEAEGNTAPANGDTGSAAAAAAPEAS